MPLCPLNIAFLSPHYHHQLLVPVLTGVACPYPHSPDHTPPFLDLVHAGPRVAYLISDRICHRLLSTCLIYSGIAGYA
ncbi:hypothetical protein GUJ93_ZPchr0014g47532 [Zizania palustris]|uniref:Uncharacterized protein n=1 Tax=Zizania palustris TaxID=103762 RepID=A0A8J5SWV7_ZIZPA|nr:hypothetical protein GUJ93_ZPchr0014g47532 [Zizania palustris]